jgi:hypothetical protein
MTRKDYILLANELSVGRKEAAKHDGLAAKYGFSIAVKSLCDALARDNPRFDSDKFVDAIYK